MSPQELVLYRGTWLQNLDPMEEFSEAFQSVSVEKGSGREA